MSDSSTYRPDGPTRRPRILLTGVTGFLGQAVLRALMEFTEDVDITVLVRSRGALSGDARAKRLLKRPVFNSWTDSAGVDTVARAFEQRVRVLDSDLMSLTTFDESYQVVIHSASSVSFDPPIDEAFQTNVDGTRRLYQALLDSEQGPHVIHVSTAYVGGISKGVMQEGRLDHTVDWQTEHRAAMQARKRVEAESRTPENLNRYLRKAQSLSGRMGPKAVATEAENARSSDVTRRLIKYGRTRAESLGWTDVYTFTKAMAERAAEDMWAGAGHHVTFVRPSIIESAQCWPSQGWIDGFKVADPLIMAYARGLLREFPGLADSVLDIIPVDHVVGAILALTLDALGNSRTPAHSEGYRENHTGADYYHLASGTSNPLHFHQMVSTVRDYFTAHPIPDDSGHPIQVPEWSFPSLALIDQRFRLREISTHAGQSLVAHLPATRRTRAWTNRLQDTASKTEELRRFTDLYRHYTKTEMVFDDTTTRRLFASLPGNFPAELNFDITAIDWDRYFHDVHLPAITELTKIYSRSKHSAPRNRNRLRAIAANPNALAVFDLDGTVIASNIIQQYISVVHATKPFWKWPGRYAGLLGIAPGLLREESRNRSELIRMVNRRFKGFRATDLRSLVSGNLGRRIRDSIRPEARRLISEHRAAGHRIVLLTGALDILVEPIADLFDEIVATRMDTTADDILTGFLATPPLVDEARANWLRMYADSHGADLAISTGYGDSLSDAAWLDLVGEPVAVSPDLGLYRIAAKKKWKVLEW